MFSITSEALQQFKRVLVAEGVEEKAIRIFLAGGGCCGPTLALDIVEKGGIGDIKYENNVCTVFIDRIAYDELKGATLDFINKGKQNGFFLSGLRRNSCCG